MKASSEDWGGTGRYRESMETPSRGPGEVLRLASLKKGEKEVEHLLLAENPAGTKVHRCLENHMILLDHRLLMRSYRSKTREQVLGRGNGRIGCYSKESGLRIVLVKRNLCRVWSRQRQGQYRVLDPVG